jgi:hypothetical protein
MEDPILGVHVVHPKIFAAKHNGGELRCSGDDPKKFGLHCRRNKAMGANLHPGAWHQQGMHLADFRRAGRGPRCPLACQRGMRGQRMGRPVQAGIRWRNLQRLQLPRGMTRMPLCH